MLHKQATAAGGNRGSGHAGATTPKEDAGAAESPPVDRGERGSMPETVVLAVQRDESGCAPVITEDVLGELWNGVKTEAAGEETKSRRQAARSPAWVIPRPFL